MPALEEDKKIIEGATVLNSSSLLVKLAKSGVIATEAKYHRKCIVMFYGAVQNKKEASNPTTTRFLSPIVLHY